MILMVKTLKYYRVEYLLIAPALLTVLLVIFYPIVYAIDISLYETRFLEKVEFTGLSNYAAFFASRDGLVILTNTLVLVAGSLLVTLPIGMGLALLVNAHIRLKRVYRTLLILPWVISQVITAMLWGWIANAQFGIIGLITDSLGIAPIDYFNDPATAMASLIFVNAWRTFPFAMLLFLAALQTVPKELTEAGEMDGASSWSSFWEITFPIIKPTVLVVVIMLSLSYFNHIDLPFILTGGGPLGKTNILALEAYKQAFENNELGYGSAISVLVFIVNIILSLLYLRMLRSERSI